jgi:hypothetical protein
VKPHSLLRRFGVLLIVALAPLYFGAAGQAKEIRLRTETIATTRAAKLALASAVSKPGFVVLHAGFGPVPGPIRESIAAGRTDGVAIVNGISDAWEEYYFGCVCTNRTATTHTDGNGMSDYAKFIAGLNPTNPASRFYFTRITQTNRLVPWQWTVGTNRLYQVSASTDLKSWSPVTAWLQAFNDPTMNYSATNSGSGAQFYRVQVLP